MRKVLPLIILSLLALSMLVAIPVRAASSSNGGPLGPDGISPVTLPTSTSDEADYSTACPGGLSGCTAPASNSWGSTIFSVTYTGTVAITITDCCYEGDYYALYSTTDPTGLTGWTLVGTTDQVDTGSELAAPTYDPFWTGTGSAYSSTTFNIPQTGTVLYVVRDVIFNTMVTLLGSSCGGSDVVYDGCSATGISVSSGWSPAGFDISFAAGTTDGCLSGGATSWAPVSFTDGSSAAISVSGAAPAGVCASMTMEDLFTSQPAGTTSPSVTSPNYYDLSILGLTAGTAHVCLTTALASASTVLLYWDGSSWVSASGTTFSSGTLCGDTPVTALATPSTPLVIGTSSAPPPTVPEFGLPVALVAAFSLLAIAVLNRKLKPTVTTPR